MSFGRANRAVGVKTVGATALTVAALACALATGDSAYGASLKQDVNSPVTELTQFTNPANPQPIVPPKPAAPARTAGKAKPPASLPQTTPAETAATVNKLLAPRQSDPNVPLPQENLAEIPAENAPLSGPSLYGHNELGTGLWGLFWACGSRFRRIAGRLRCPQHLVRRPAPRGASRRAVSALLRHCHRSALKMPGSLHRFPSKVYSPLGVGNTQPRHNARPVYNEGKNS